MACNENTPLLHCTSDRRNHIVDIPAIRQPFEQYNESSSSLNSESSTSSLSIEELQYYKQDPCWYNFRLCAFCAFWIMWLLILITACLLAYMQKDACARQLVTPLSTEANLLTTMRVATNLAT